MVEDVKSGRIYIGVVCFLFCIVFAICVLIDVSSSAYKEKVMLEDCSKYSTTMTITKKEITGAVKYRRCNLYAEYEGAEYRMQYVPVDTFNSYEKGDSIECLIWVNDEGSIMKVQPLENV